VHLDWISFVPGEATMLVYGRKDRHPLRKAQEKYSKEIPNVS